MGALYECEREAEGGGCGRRAVRGVLGNVLKGGEKREREQMSNGVSAEREREGK